MIIFLKLASSYIANKRRAHKSYAPKAIVRNREKSGNTASRKLTSISFAQTKEAK
jgi:hypothetical protein